MEVVVSVIGIIVAFAALMFLAVNNMSPIYTGLIVTFIVIFTSGLPVAGTITDVFGPGVASFVSGYFVMYVLGSIMGKIYDVSGGATSIASALCRLFLGKDVSHVSLKRQVATAVIMMATIGGVMCYGGINNVVLIITLYPFAANVCKTCDIPQRWAIGMTVAGTSSFGLAGPWSPQSANVIGMTVMGTDSGAAWIPGLVCMVVEFIVMVLAFYFVIKRDKAKGLGYIPSKKDKAFDENASLPHPGLAAVPMIFVFVAFAIFKVNINITLIGGVILSLIIFRKRLGSVTDVVNLVNEGGKAGGLANLYISGIVGFGAVIATTVGYGSMLDGLVGLNIHPYIKLIIIVFVFAMVTGSSSNGARFGLEALGGMLVSQGYSAAALHRIAVTAGTVPDSLPTCGAIPMACDIAGNTVKEGYGGMFISTVVATLAGTITVTLMCIMFPGLV